MQQCIAPFFMRIRFLFMLMFMLRCSGGFAINPFRMHALQA